MKTSILAAPPVSTWLNSTLKLKRHFYDAPRKRKKQAAMAMIINQPSP
jgi:hypothetical protein